jgi:hypothetical protein
MKLTEENLQSAIADWQLPRSGRAGARYSSQARETFEPSLGLFVVRKSSLVLAKRARVIVATSVDKPRRMFDVEHLVIKDVLDKPFRYFV